MENIATQIHAVEEEQLGGNIGEIARAGVEAIFTWGPDRTSEVVVAPQLLSFEGMRDEWARVFVEGKIAAKSLYATVVAVGLGARLGNEQNRDEAYQWFAHVSDHFSEIESTAINEVYALRARLEGLTGANDVRKLHAIKTILVGRDDLECVVVLLNSVDSGRDLAEVLEHFDGDAGDVLDQSSIPVAVDERLAAISKKNSSGWWTRTENSPPSSGVMSRNSMLDVARTAIGH